MDIRKSIGRSWWRLWSPRLNFEMSDVVIAFFAIVICGFLKWWVSPTNPWGFPTKNDHFEVFWGYHHFRKHPYPRSSNVLSLKRTATRTSQKDILDGLPTHQFFRCNLFASSFREGIFIFNKNGRRFCWEVAAKGMFWTWGDNEYHELSTSGWPWRL